ncbi:MAG: NUDIX hydrolase [Pseudomonadota bacterium]
MTMEVKPWERKSSRMLADCRIFSLFESTAVSPVTSKEHDFYYIETGDWVNVVPVTPANELVCIRQFRHGNEEITIEIPGGMVDLGEAPSAAAARECLEETGYEAGELVSLGVLSPNPALFPNRLHTFLAPNVKRVGDVANTSTEHTEVQLIPMAQLPEFLVSGEIDHALVVATLWRMLYFLK